MINRIAALAVLVAALAVPAAAYAATTADSCPPDCPICHCGGC
jgi:hypothetical protein